MNLIKYLTMSFLLLAPTIYHTVEAAEVACVNDTALSFACNDIDLTGRISLADFVLSPPLISDVWGYVDLNTNIEYAIVGLYNGVAVIDVSDAENPVEVATLAGGNSTHRDIKVYQYFDQTSQSYKAYAYVSSNLPEGIEILDLNDLTNSLTVVGRHFENNNAHNVYISNVDHSTGMALTGFEAYLHLPISPAGGAFDISSLTNPIVPEYISSVSLTEGHDIVSFTVTDDRTAQCQDGHNPCEIIVNFSGSDKVVEFWDVTNKQSPYKISAISYTNASYPHSGWVSDDGMFIFTHDEADELNFNLNTTMRTIDISDLTKPSNSNVWYGPTAAIDHNGMTLGQHYFMSNYSRGLTVLDVSEPNDPKHLAYFDTYPNSDSTEFEGAWGVYPYLPSGKILVTDMTNGLFILTLNPDAAVDNITSTPNQATVPSKSSGGGIFYLLLLAAWTLINKRVSFNRKR